MHNGYAPSTTFFVSSQKKRGDSRRVPTEWSRITINVSPALAEEIRAAAKAERRSVASWVTLLIEAKLARAALPLAAEREQAPYGDAPRMSAPAHLRPHEKTVVARKKVG